MWHLRKTLDGTPNLKWSVVRCAILYSNISKKCLLYLYGKLDIITYQRQHELLNKRSELFANAIMSIGTFRKTLEWKFLEWLFFRARKVFQLFHDGGPYHCFLYVKSLRHERVKSELNFWKFLKHLIEWKSFKSTLAGVGSSEPYQVSKMELFVKIFLENARCLIGLWTRLCTAYISALQTTLRLTTRLH